MLQEYFALDSRSKRKEYLRIARHILPPDDYAFLEKEIIEITLELMDSVISGSALFMGISTRAFRGKIALHKITVTKNLSWLRQFDRQVLMGKISGTI